MLVGRLLPFRYFTFSCVVLMISVSFLPSTISSKTHMLTSLTNLSGNRSALKPTSLAMAEPQLPLPTIQTFLGDISVSTLLRSTLNWRDVEGETMRGPVLVVLDEKTKLQALF